STRTPTTAIYPLSLHDALPIFDITVAVAKHIKSAGFTPVVIGKRDQNLEEYLVRHANIESPEFAETRDSIFNAISSSRFGVFHIDRKSTRLNSSHVKISYAVFC